jgi:hypothetical protein
MKLIWQNGEGLIANDATEWPITVKPALPFDFDGMYFNDESGYRLHLRPGGGRVQLEPTEQMAVHAYIAALTPPAPVLNLVAAEAALSDAVQNHLDEAARSRGYGNMLSLCSYRGSTVPKFAAEAIAALAWRDAVWAHCYQALADFKAGNRTAPTAAELIAELPPLVW